VDFEITAMLGQAKAHVAAGRIVEALRLIHEASSVAVERQLKNQRNELKTAEALVDIMQGRYESARQSLEQAVAGEDATSEARIALARTYVRMGDFALARRHLDQATADVERSGEAGVHSIIDAAFGELHDERSDPRAAVDAYRKVASLDERILPDDIVNEVRCRLAALDDRVGSAEREKRLVDIVARARKLGHRVLALKCSVDLARERLQNHHYAAAFDALREAQSGPSFTPGLELEALAHYWRGLALNGQGHTDEAKTELTQAKAAAGRIQAALPGTFRQSYSARASIRPLFE
jgi:tetratricopeptide (TPR) repeat protein